ncbi:MAG: F0F1 ATP synthase subunit B [Acidimicrobiia bacterium]|jgi:F-type H+-transporting ATPase subunit b|nr:F0F1 ATP synthase subunit B [Acidimicrobiia bacterium]MBP8179697.1 F0F1 ATP synthase subunit B [Acidimicrobiia bacterium]
MYGIANEVELPQVFLATEAVEGEEGGHGGIEAPNPLVVEPNEFIYGSIAFLVLFFVLKKFAFPALKKAVKDREDKIRGDLERAESARVEAESELAAYKKQLAEARSEASQLVANAAEEAAAVRAQLMRDAEADVAKHREQTLAALDGEVARARVDLQREVSGFAVQLAEKIVEKNLDRDAQQALIDRFITDLESAS